MIPASVFRGSLEDCKRILRMLLWLVLAATVGVAHGSESNDYQLGAGDIIHIVVFQNPDLTIDARVSESGIISYPLIGKVRLGGLSIDAAEQEIAKRLMDGHFVQHPQINIVLSQNHGNQVSVLGQVNRPGRYPLENFNMRVSDILATAGGIANTGTDVIILVGERDGKAFRKEIDIAKMFLDSKRNDDILVRGGDAIYVHRAPMYYIYGEVQRPGSYRVEDHMTVMQALAEGGGPTQRGTEKGLKIYRRGKDGRIEEVSPELTSLVNADDVLYVRESLF